MHRTNRPNIFGETGDRQKSVPDRAREWERGRGPKAPAKSREETPNMGLGTTAPAVELVGCRSVQLRLPGI